MTVYKVTAKRWEHGWELHVDGVGVTQTNSLASAERDASHYIELMTEEADPDVVVVPEIGGALEVSVRAARSAAARLAEVQSAAALASRAAVGELMEAGFSGAEIARVLGISPQRVSQLSNGRRNRPTTTKSATAAAKRAVKSTEKSSLSTTRHSAGATTKSKSKSIAAKKPSGVGVTAQKP